MVIVSQYSIIIRFHLLGEIVFKFSCNQIYEAPDFNVQLRKTSLIPEFYKYSIYLSVGKDLCLCSYLAGKPRPTSSLVGTNLKSKHS